MFPGAFRDPKYLDWEREYKWETHRRWQEALGQREFLRLLEREEYGEIAMRAVRVEQRSRHSMIFSFEKMALRDAIRSTPGAQRFARGLYDLLHGSGSDADRFDRWVDVVAGLPRSGTRVLTWPLVTVFGFIAQPRRHLFVKPLAMRAAAAAYDFPLRYASRPNWETYASALGLAELVRRELRDLRPRDFIDIQSFLWVVGSDEYR